MNINDIVSLLVKRDGISENEAYNLIEECRAELNEVLSGENVCCGIYEDACEIVYGWLGLEPDYIDIILG